MAIKELHGTDAETAVRIRRIREAFTDARRQAGLKDAPEEFSAFTNWDNWLKV
jgi:hypothetical protein